MDQRFFTAQYGQDQIIDRLCYPEGEGKQAGIFLEVGAWDGVDLSNTFMLEKRRGWTGVLVEPIEARAEHAKHNRWSPVWTGCIWDRDGDVDFLHICGYSEMLSGVEEGIHPSHRARISKEIEDHKQIVNHLSRPSLTLNSLMDKFKLPRVDFLSIDVGTAELRVLRAYDPNKYPIKAILLDTNGYNDSDLKEWFGKNGYLLHWKHERADEYLYVRPDLSWSWQS